MSRNHVIWIARLFGIFTVLAALPGPALADLDWTPVRPRPPGRRLVITPDSATIARLREQVGHGRVRAYRNFGTLDLVEVRMDSLHLSGIERHGDVLDVPRSLDWVKIDRLDIGAVGGRTPSDGIMGAMNPNDLGWFSILFAGAGAAMLMTRPAADGSVGGLPGFAVTQWWPVYVPPRVYVTESVGSTETIAMGRIHMLPPWTDHEIGRGIADEAGRAGYRVIAAKDVERELIAAFGKREMKRMKELDPTPEMRKVILERTGADALLTGRCRADSATQLRWCDVWLLDTRTGARRLTAEIPCIHGFDPDAMRDAALELGRHLPVRQPARADTLLNRAGYPAVSIH